IARATAILESDGPATERLEQMLREHLRSIDLYHPESSQWFEPATTTTQRTPRTRGKPPPNAERLNHRYAALVARAVEEGQGLGEFRPELDPKVAALGLLGAANWLTRWHSKRGRLGIAEISATLVTTRLHGLTIETRPPRGGAARHPSAHPTAGCTQQPEPSQPDERIFEWTERLLSPRAPVS